jgi:hypothetical protein
MVFTRVVMVRFCKHLLSTLHYILLGALATPLPPMLYRTSPEPCERGICSWKVRTLLMQLARGDRWFECCVTCPVCVDTSVRGLLEKGRDHPEDGVHKSGDGKIHASSSFQHATFLIGALATPLPPMMMCTVIRTSSSEEGQGSPGRWCSQEW